MKTTSSKGRWIAVAIVAVLVLILLFWLAASQPAVLVLAFSSEAMALAVIGAVAVGIERMIEMFWTLMGLISDRYWPLGHWSVEYMKLMDDLDTGFTPFYEKANLAIDKLAKDKKWVDENVDLIKARQELAQVQAGLENLRNSVGGDTSEVVTSALKGITFLQRNYPDDRDLATAAAVASQAVDGVTSFVNSFKENPGRRLISIYFGMLLGLVLAWLIGLDLFQATLGSSETASLSLTSHMGVACTGLILGLGASPTHEVISILKEVKLRRRDENK